MSRSTPVQPSASEQAEAGPARAAAGVGVDRRWRPEGHLEQPARWRRPPPPPGGRRGRTGTGSYAACSRRARPPGRRAASPRRPGPASGSARLQPRGEPRGEVGELFGPVLGPVVAAAASSSAWRACPTAAWRRPGRQAGRALRPGRVGEQLGDSPGRGLVFADAPGRRCPPGRVPLGGIRRAASRSAKPASAAPAPARSRRARRPWRARMLASATSAAADERLGGLADHAHRRLQVGLAAGWARRDSRYRPARRSAAAARRKGRLHAVRWLGEVFPGVGEWAWSRASAPAWRSASLPRDAGRVPA